eukprot:4577626-Alexandrium_andersonii.AAC.1
MPVVAAAISHMAADAAHDNGAAATAALAAQVASEGGAQHAENVAERPPREDVDVHDNAMKVDDAED